MEIKNGKLISVNEYDIIDGVFFNEEITEIGDNCFRDMKSLISVYCPNVIKIGNY